MKYFFAFNLVLAEVKVFLKTICYDGFCSSLGCLDKNSLCERLPCLSSQGSRGRVVKAMDSKSIGVTPRRFESYLLRFLFFLVEAFQL